MHWLIVGGGAIGTALGRTLSEQGDSADLVSTSDQNGLPDGVTHQQLDSWEWANVHQCISDLNQLPDRVVTTCGLLWQGEQQPEKRLEDLTPEHLINSLNANTLAPMAVLQALTRRLQRQSRLQALVLTAKVGSISDNRLGGWYSYRATKAATNMLIRTTAIEWARRFPDCAVGAYHPGTTISDLSSPFQARVPEGQLKSAADAAQCLCATMSKVSPATTGQFWNWDGSTLLW